MGANGSSVRANGSCVGANGSCVGANGSSVGANGSYGSCFRVVLEFMRANLGLFNGFRPADLNKNMQVRTNSN